MAAPRLFADYPPELRAAVDAELILLGTEPQGQRLATARAVSDQANSQEPF